MVSAQTTIINATGLHARPASLFVAEVKKFKDTSITIRNLDKEGAAPLKASSIMAVLSAGLSTGTNVEIVCEGAEEQEALDALVALIDSGFGE